MTNACNIHALVSRIMSLYMLEADKQFFTSEFHADPYVFFYCGTVCFRLIKRVIHLESSSLTYDKLV